MDYSEKWGKDVEEAVRLALVDLQVERDQVEVIVLEEPTKGFFGIGSKLAKVRVEKKQPEPEKEEVKEKESAKKEKKETFKRDKKRDEKRDEKPSEKPVKKEKHHSKNEGRKIDEKQKSVESQAGEDLTLSIREKPADLVEVLDSPAIPFLNDIVDKMGLTLEIKAFESEGYLYIDINGKDSGTIIGKRGQTLDSIQYLTSLVVNKNSEKYIRVIINAENYREKREKTLEQLANRQADKVVRSGRSIRFEPMNPYERKVIHATLQKNPKVTTRSEGEEPYRRVVIELK